MKKKFPDKCSPNIDESYFILEEENNKMGKIPNISDFNIPFSPHFCVGGA